MLKEEDFIKANIENWTKLDEYNKKLSKKKISSLSGAELKEYTTLFRTAGHHLSFAKTYYAGSKAVDYLNQLTGSSHSYFYTRDKFVFSDIMNYFTKGFPMAFRKNIKYFLAGVMAFLLGAVLILALGMLDSSFIYYFLPENLAESNNITGQLADETWYYPVLSSFIMSNNIRVSILAISLGITFGAGTLYVLFYNGLTMGAFYSLVITHHMDQARFWSLILPHGFIELTAIFLSGAAGFIIGKNMLVPGDLTRKDACVKAAKEAAYFIPGIVLMLVIAGLIEGFFTPLAIADGYKLLFSFVTLLLLTAYFIFVSKRASSNNG